MKTEDRFIVSCKKAVDELIKVIGAEIDMSKIEKESTGKNAIKIKKKAITKCKLILGTILNHDRNQQEWVKSKLQHIVKISQPVIESLFVGLEEPILVNDDSMISANADSVSTAIDTKEIAFNDVMEIDNIVHDIQNILADDDITMAETEYKGGYAEKYVDKFEKMKNLSGYDEEQDVVIIDPNGTIGDIIEIEGLRIALPKKPLSHNIDGFSDRKEYQYWRRKTPPRELTVKSARKFEDFIASEYDKKRNGYWFYNYGKATYITGAHWFLMTHCYTGAEGGYYYFSEAQQKLFYYLEAAWCDPRCLGIILEKIRRFGATDCALAFSLCKTTSARNKMSGMTSKTDVDAKANFFRLTTMFSRLPFYMKPLCIDEKSKSELEFAQPGNRIQKSGNEKDSVDVALNTRMTYRPTQESSHDGDALLVYIGDEYSKWKKQNGNTINHFNMVKKCLMKGKRVVGKGIFLSTVEFVTGKDANDPDSLSGDKFKYLYYRSNPRERNANGQTDTGLYKIFISCYEHYEGFIDRYGRTIQDDPRKPVKTMDGGTVNVGVKTYLDNIDKSLESNPRERLEARRKDPRTEEDGFALAINMCMFNQANILEQLKYNESLDQGVLRRGNFEWYQGNKDCGVVYFVDKPDGRFLVSWIPDEGVRNNVRREDNDQWVPLNKNIGNFGVDPYRVDKTVDGKGSKGSIHGFSVVNSAGAPNHNFFLEYVERPDSVDIFMDDAIKAMVFYGMPALIENNVNNLIEEMYRRGYRRFSMHRTDKEKDKLSETELRKGGMPSTGENVSQMITSAIESFVEYNVGHSEMFFDRTLRDWMAFDSKNRTKRDASISSAYALIGATRRKRRKSIEEEPRGITKPLFVMYDNRGTYGKRLDEK